MRALGLDPVDDTRATFHALCDGMSRPGTIQRVPNAPADHAVIATLVDHEVSTHTVDEDLQAALANQGRFDGAPPENADIVHTHGVPPWDVRDLDRGTLVEPSDGATAIYRVESLSTTSVDGQPTVTLSGPGVPDSRTVSIGLSRAELTAIGHSQTPYPRGIDAVFTVEDRLVAIPRSVSMEVE